MVCKKQTFITRLQDLIKTRYRDKWGAMNDGLYRFEEHDAAHGDKWGAMNDSLYRG